MRPALVVMLAACVAPPPPAGEELAALPPLAPLADTPLCGRDVQEGFQLQAGELERAASTLVGARAGSVRRQARLVPGDAVARTRIPAGVTELRFFLSDPYAVTVAPGCRAELEVSWDASHETVELELAATPLPHAWQSVHLRAEARATPSTLTVAVEAEDCPGALLVAHSEVTPFAPRPKSAARPNVVMLMLDTMRRDRLDCGARTRELAPNLDALCDRGLFFDNAFSASSWTYPSIASVMTGVWPAAHHARRIDGARRYLSRDIPTLAELLRKAGYDTFGVNGNPNASNGLSRGFDAFVETYGKQAMAHNEARRADHVVDLALTHLRERRREPFFLYLLFVDVHEPVDAVRKTGESVAACAGVTPVPYAWDAIAQPTDRPTDDDLRRIACRRALYDASLRFLDRELGRLVDGLAAAGLADTTALVVLADHGEELWDHAAEEYRDKPAGTTRWGVDHGHTLYQELVHVPLLYVPPGGAGRRAGGHEEALVSTTDVFATVLSLTGTPQPSQSAARDLGWALEGRAGLARPLAVSEGTLYGPDRLAVTTPQLRAIHTEPEHVVVFDRLEDPLEKAPLPQDHALYLEGAGLLRALGQKAQRERPAADAEALRALGYVE